jgi:O-antigen/teichoic acid export membrane protein
MSLKKLASQTVIYGLSSIIGRMLNYMLTPLFTRLFATAAYGIITELYSYVVFLLVVLTYGMETAFFRFSKLENSQKVYSNALFSVLLTSLLFVFSVFFFLENISEFLGYSKYPEYILWFAIIISIDSFLTIPFAKLRNENKAFKFAGIKLINILLNIGLNLYFLVYYPYLYKHNPDSEWLIFYHPNFGIAYVFLSNLLASIFTFLLLLPEIFKVKFTFDIKIYKKMLNYALPLLIVGLAGSINEVLDRILLKFLLTDKSEAMSQLGIYGANYKLSILMTLFIQTFRYAAEPFFFSGVGKSDSKKLYADVMKYFIIFGLFIFLGIMLYIDILKYFIDTEYYSGLNVVPILLLANLFLGIIFNLSIWYKLTNLTKFGAIISVIGALITVIFNVLLIPFYGIMGAALATLICYFSMMIISYFWGQKYYFIDYELKTILKYFALALVLFAFSYLLPLNTQILKYFVNTVLLFIFTIYVFKKEPIFYSLKKKIFRR